MSAAEKNTSPKLSKGEIRKLTSDFLQADLQHDPLPGEIPAYTWPSGKLNSTPEKIEAISPQKSSVGRQYDLEEDFCFPTDTYPITGPWLPRITGIIGAGMLTIGIINDISPTFFGLIGETSVDFFHTPEICGAILLTAATLVSKENQRRQKKLDKNNS